MTARPEVSKPTLQKWHDNQDLLLRLLEHIEGKVLNLDHWGVEKPGEIKDIMYKDVIPHLRGKYVTFEWMEVMKLFYLSLPTRFNQIKKEMKNVFIMFTTDLRENGNYILALEQYTDYLEQQLEEQKNIPAQNSGELEKIKDDLQNLTKKIETLNRPVPRTTKKKPEDNIDEGLINDD